MNGRQVCSTWRSEIPKIFAKKYLEDPDMVQIYFRCDTLIVEDVNREMGAEMVFDRYDGEAKARCVFRENLLATGRKIDGNSEAFERQFGRNKSYAWRKGLEWYLGVKPGDYPRRPREAGPRFDLPPYQIRIKTKANYTELPNLEFDVPKREISFEWEGMFDRFYAEGERLDKRDHEIFASTAA